MMMEDMELIAVKCAACGDTFWSLVGNTDTLCDYCENFEPLDFDDWEE